MYDRTWQYFLIQLAMAFGYIVLLLLLVAALSALARKLTGVKRVRGFLPEPAPRPNGIARGTEAALLVTLGIGVLGWTTAWASGFDLSSWQNLRSDLIGINNAIVVAVASCVLLSGLLALCWRTGPALVLGVVGLCAFGFVCNGNNLATLIHDNRPMPTEADCPLEMLTGDNTVGADVWVNGVYFGQTPVKTTLAEVLKVPEWRDKKLNGQGRTIPGWLHLQLRWDIHDWDDFSKRQEKQRNLFVRFSLNGEPMEFGGGSSGPTCWLDKRSRKWNTSAWEVSHAFPNYNAEVKRLVTWLQLHDYRLDDEWLAALESHGDPGWQTFRKAAKNDPQCQAVFDQIVDRKFHLDQVRTADEAWNALERIAAEADQQMDYASDSLAGLAVDRIAPKLDAGRLARFVRDAIRRHPTVNSGSTQGLVREDSMFLATYPRHTKRGPHEAPPSAFVWAHAVWRLDKSLDQLDDSRDNPLEEILAPFFIVERENGLIGQDWVKALGGSFVGRWQRWQLSQPDSTKTVHIGDQWVSQVEWDAANSKTPAGKKWRAEHPDKLRSFAESATKNFTFTKWEKLEFLFLDHDGTAQSEAAKFWPQFRELIAQHDYGLDGGHLHARWEYLRRLEPLPTLDMYFNCVLEMKQRDHLPHEIRETIRRIPSEKSLPLLRKIVDHLASEQAAIADKNAYPYHDLRLKIEQWTGWLDELSLTPAERFAKLCESSNLWNALELLNGSFDAPLFPQLVESPSAKARLEFVNFLKTQPTPRHREWLTKLSTDTDNTVSTAAKEALQALQLQAAEPPPKRKFSPPAAKLGDITFEEPPLKKGDEFN